MAVVNRGLASVNLVDFSRETQMHSIYVAALTSGNIVAKTVLWDAYIAAVNDLTQCNVYTKLMGNQQANIPVNPPNVMNAQRGTQWIAGYSDDVTGARFSFRMAGAIYTANLRVGSDHADMTATDVAAFKTAFEDFAVSPEGNAVTLNDLVTAGANEGISKLVY